MEAAGVGLFSVPACWLAATQWFPQRLSETPSNWSRGNKSGVWSFIKNKQWKMTPSALYFQMALQILHLQLGLTADCGFKSTADIH